MLYLRKWQLAVVCLLALALVPFAPARRGTAQAPGYTVTDLGTLGGDSSKAYGLDECGRVVGEATLTAGASALNHPFYWNGTTMTDLGTFDGSGTMGTASGVNNAGAVAGSAQNAKGETRPFRWTSAGGKTDIGGAGGAAAYDINESNQVVGQWEISALQDRAFIWSQATGMQIITAPWGTPISAYGVNNAGHVVGTTQTPAGPAHAFLLSGGVVTEIGTLGGTHSFAYGVNESDVVVGYANTPSSGASSPYNAFRWTAATGIQNLGNLGGVRSRAYGINDSGQIVGYSEIASGALRAFVWADDNSNGAPDEGEMKDLNTVVAAPDWTFQEARAINNRGQIVGIGLNPDGKVHAFLLTPNNVGPSPCDPTPTPTPTPVPGTLQFSAATYTVGEGGGSAVISVSRTGGSDGAVSVNYATSNGTATANPSGDYDAAGGTLNFADGETTKTFSVTITDDSLDEPDETVNLTLSNPAGGAALGTQSTAVLTITDNDAAPTLSISKNVTVVEGNTGSSPATTARFVVTMTGTSAQTVTVLYNTVDGVGTASAGEDYVSASGTVTYSPGETGTKNIDISVVGDTTDEPNENFIVSLSSPTNATFAVVPDDTFGIGTITDDDGESSLNIDDVTVTEGNSGTTAATFTVSLLPASGQTVTVIYATADGTATAGSDYTAKSGTLTFDPGQTSKTVTINVTGDTTPEGHEKFVVNLSNPTNATLGDSQGQGQINNDDTSLSINDLLFFHEGNSGTTDFVFTVSLSHNSVVPVSVNYATSDDTTTAGTDYIAANGTLNIPAGSTSGTITVQVKGDNTFENDENFFVNLSGATNATIADAQGRGRIQNDEAASFFQISGGPNFFIAENGGTATFTITREGSTAGGTSVNYFTGDSTATAGSDYTAVSGTYTFAEGEMSKTFAVTVNDDTLDEADETIIVSVTGGFGATMSTGGSVFLKIIDNDAQPSFQFSAPTYSVGEGGHTSTITVTRTGGSNGGVTVNYLMTDGTATAGSDYTATSGTLTFAEGETSKTFAVTVNDDALDEADETVNLALVTPIGGALGTQSTATLTITDDDAVPSLSINDAPKVVELGGVATFTVTLSAPSGKTVTVNYETADGTADTITDYRHTSGTLTFSPGQTSQNIFVQVGLDNFDEPDEETFFVNLSGATNATIADGQGVGTILDNDATPALFINDITITEGDSGTTNATFTVSLGPGSGQPVTVDYRTSNNTAAAGSDYTAKSGTLSFAPLEVTKTVTVQVTGDTVNEPNESFYVILSNPSHAFLLDAFGECFITNDDTPSLRFSQATYPVGESAHFVTVAVTRTGDPSNPVGVSFATSDGTATERRDYTAVSGRLQFAAGETSKTFDVLLTEDAYPEPEENINLTLSNPTGGASLGSQATATVNLAADDNPPPGVNPIDVSSEFVRQHYHDFLNREPDASGLAFWTGEIEQCGANAACREVKRINVSAAFFLSIEFQETGYLVERTYKTAFGDTTSPNVAGTVPVIRLNEFLPDTRRIAEGVVVNVGNWQAQLEANKNAYMLEFVGRQRFLNAYPQTLTPTQFVDALNTNAGGALDATERQNLINELTANNTSAGRASVLRKVAEDANLAQQEFNRAFVLMQFYGYLRRNPDDPQDTDFRGWKFWLDKLNAANGNYVQAEMVKAFLDSIEYRTRFAP